MQKTNHNALFQGHWESSFHPLKISFNANAWRLVNDGYDNSKGCLFGLFSENDGASFSLDLALKSPQLDYNYEFAEAEFFARMFNLDNQCQRDGNFPLQISNLDFNCGRYFFHNRKYGEQTVIRAMHISENFVIGIGMAWPRDMCQQPLPPKFAILVDRLHLA